MIDVSDSPRPRFAGHVVETAEKVLESFGSGGLFSAARPLVTLAKPQLRHELVENPDEVARWLLEAQKHINEALCIYEDETGYKPGERGEAAHNSEGSD